MDEQKRVGTREAVHRAAYIESIKYGVSSFVAAGIGSFLATKYNTKYAKYTSAAAKLGIPLMVGMFFWSLMYELTILDGSKNPDHYYGAAQPEKKELAKRLPMYQRALNTIADHPFIMIASLGFPLAGTIFYRQLGQTHLSFSQKVMHSRVFAQGGVIAILLSTMSIKQYMDRRGRFGEQD